MRILWAENSQRTFALFSLRHRDIERLSVFLRAYIKGFPYPLSKRTPPWPCTRDDPLYRGRLNILDMIRALIKFCTQCAAVIRKVYTRSTIRSCLISSFYYISGPAVLLCYFVLSSCGHLKFLIITFDDVTRMKASLFYAGKLSFRRTSPFVDTKGWIGTALCIQIRGNGVKSWVVPGRFSLDSIVIAIIGPDKERALCADVFYVAAGVDVACFEIRMCEFKRMG